MVTELDMAGFSVIVVLTVTIGLTVTRTVCVIKSALSDTVVVSTTAEGVTVVAETNVTGLSVTVVFSIAVVQMVSKTGDGVRVRMDCVRSVCVSTTVWFQTSGTVVV